MQKTCKHCGANIEYALQPPHWRSGQGALKQYCWVDQVEGSQLHEPVENVSSKESEKPEKSDMHPDAITRQLETLFDIAMGLGTYWGTLDLTICTALMDQLNGSRGLFNLVMQWVEEFDQEWKNDEDRNYLEEINAFTTKKYGELIASVKTNSSSSGEVS